MDKNRQQMEVVTCTARKIWSRQRKLLTQKKCLLICYSWIQNPNSKIMSSEANSEDLNSKLYIFCWGKLGRSEFKVLHIPLVELLNSLTNQFFPSSATPASGAALSVLPQEIKPSLASSSRIGIGTTYPGCPSITSNGSASSNNSCIVRGA